MEQHPNSIFYSFYFTIKQANIMLVQNIFSIIYIKRYAEWLHTDTDHRH